MVSTSGCPIRVRANPGHRLNVTVWDFTGPLMHELGLSSGKLRVSPNDVIKVRALNWAEWKSCNLKTSQWGMGLCGRSGTAWNTHCSPTKRSTNAVSSVATRNATESSCSLVVTNSTSRSLRSSSTLPPFSCCSTKVCHAMTSSFLNTRSRHCCSCPINHAQLRCQC